MEVSHTLAEQASKNIHDTRARKRFLNAVNKVGRPTEYCDELCMDFLACRANGLTIGQALLDIGISDTTYYRWIKEKPEFRGIAKKGKMLAKAFDDDLARDNFENRSFNFLLFESQYKRRHNCSEDAVIDCPNFSNENTAEQNIDAVIDGIANQDISPDVASKLMMIIKTKQEITVQQEIMLRLDQLEHQVKNN